MENFYVTFDASDPEQLRIGLSYDIEAEKERRYGGAVQMILVTVAGALLVLAVALGIYCIKRRQRMRLEKAKAYFDSLQTHDDPEEEDIDGDD